MTRAFVGVGANLGHPVDAVRRAIRALSSLGATRASSLYRTEPLGDPDQPWYVNAAVELLTPGPPRPLMEALRRLEAEAGRAPNSERWAPRILDLDLLLFGDLVLETPDLTLPHPGLTERRFVLEPLAELAPRLRDPRTGRTVADLLQGLDDPLRVDKIPDTAPRATLAP